MAELGIFPQSTELEFCDDLIFLQNTMNPLGWQNVTLQTVKKKKG